MKTNTAAVLKQIDAALSAWSVLLFDADESDEYSENTEHDRVEVAAMLAETIRRFAPRGSTYSTELVRANQFLSTGEGLAMRLNLVGVLRALRTAYENGYLESVVELVRAETFSDFLQQAEYLLSENYKDAAAVMIGGVLEEHLRKLSVKHSLPVTASSGDPLASGRLNDSLKGAGAYGVFEHKNVTAWLDLRNKAAHGKYDEYEKTSVEILLLGVRHLLSQFPA